MSETREQPRQWWMFYPMKGLDIADEEHDLLEPMFGDCTLVSRNHIPQIVALLRLNETPPRGRDQEGDVTYMLEKATFREQFHSFVAVRRTGIPRTRNPWDPPPLLRSAKSRAYGVSALVSLVLLARARSRAAIGLVEQLHSQISSLVMLDLQDGRFQFHVAGGRSLTARDPRDVISLSRQQIQDVLTEEPFAHLSNALLPQTPTLPTSLRRAILQSAVRLSESIHTVTESARLLGAVTSIEILVAQLGDSYEKLRHRLAALLGVDTLEAFDGKTVLRARHLYVHRGDEPEDAQTSLNAIGLALSCLLRYAQAASTFAAKSELLDYLDLISAADKVAGYFADDEHEAGPNLALLRHDRSGYELPFLSSILEPRTGNRERAQR